MKKGIAAIGFCCIDSYENLNLSYPTGNGIDCIINLRKKGVEAAAVSVVGTDPEGREMLEVLEKYQIDTSHMQVKEGKTSLFRMELKENNDRVHIENIPGVMENYVPTEEDLCFTSEYEYVHTDLFGRVLEYIPRLKENGAKLILDFSIYANDDNMKQLLPHVEYAFFSVGEGNHEKAVKLLEKAKAYGGHIMTATLGEDGSVSYDGTHFYEGKCVKVPKVVNTVGAGDSFIAGFMYGIMQGWDIPACLESGAKTSAEIVQLFNPY